MKLGADGAGVKASPLPGTGALRSRLSHYPPGLRQGMHRHRAPHISIVVAGSFRETTGCGESVICHGHVGFRADAASHAVSYGPAGALILSIETDDRLASVGPRSGVRWIRAPARFARQMLDWATAGAAPAGEEVGDRLRDLWAAAEEPRAPGDGAPIPSWLSAAADQLLANPQNLSIAALAARNGVHRVHFSRLFVRHYGMSPSVFRRRSMTAQALAAALEEGVSLACAAAHAGFADQSHMSRAVRDDCALGAGEMRKLLARHATSVQATHGDAV